MKAILIAAKSHQGEVPIMHVAVPGLGTGVGHLAPQVSAAQMAKAYREVMLDEHKYPGSFNEAQRMHLDLNRSAMLYD